MKEKRHVISVSNESARRWNKNLANAARGKSFAVCEEARGLDFCCYFAVCMLYL